MWRLVKSRKGHACLPVMANLGGRSLGKMITFIIRAFAGTWMAFTNVKYHIVVRCGRSKLWGSF
jgi:hypothetical protein